MAGTMKYKGFSLIHINIRSLLRHIDELQKQLDGFDIIAITETWLTKRADDRLLHFPNFSFIRQDRTYLNEKNIVKKGGGILLYFKTTLEPYITLLDHSTNNKHIEETWVQCKMPGHKNFTLGIIYRPPMGDVETCIKEIDKVLLATLGKGNPMGRELYLLGDFNIDYSKHGDVDKQRLRALEIKFNMSQIIKVPTRITVSSKTTIDLIMTTIGPDLISHHGTLNIIISDHLPVYLVKKKKRDIHKHTYINVRSPTLYTVPDFTNIIYDDPRWVHFWEPGLSPDLLWDIWLDIVMNSLNILCPWKSIKIRENQPDWFDSDVREAIRLKANLFDKAKISRADSDWDDVRRIKRKVRNLIIRKKRAYICNKLIENKNVPRKFWKSINNNLSIGNIKHATPNIRVYNTDRLLVDGLAAATEINNYYSTVGYNLARVFSLAWKANSFNLHLYFANMNFRFIGEKETAALIKTLPSNKSSNVPCITMKYLKDALQITTFEICHILNECLSQTKIPLAWKIGTITPVPKNGPSYNVSDYRPISGLPAPSKLIERAVYNQLVYHLETYGLLDNRQHGFRRDHSTATALFELIQFIYNMLDNKEYVCCIYIDYSKAFDTLDHDILCSKLGKYGLSSSVIAWCRGYLKDRKQCVKINDIVSGAADVTYGVPQGSILGPLLFIIYVNDIFKQFCDEDPKILLYADDTVLYYAHTSLKQLENVMSAGLCKLSGWCDLNKLTINKSKTKFEVFRPKNVCINARDKFEVKIGNVPLEEVDTYTYLGVKLDTKLKLDGFLKGKCNKINIRLYQLGKIRKYITNNIANLIYKQTIVPLFDYADFLIESGQNVLVERLDSLHSKALQIIDCKANRRAGDTQLEYIYKLHSPLTRRREHHCAIMYGLSRKQLNLDVRRPKIKLRSRNNVKFKSYVRNLVGLDKSPMLRGVRLWDQIPQSVQRALTKVKFKAGLKNVRLK